MTCAACVNTIESYLQTTPGIAKATVSLLAERAEVEYDPSQISDPIAIKDFIEEIGYTAKPLNEVRDSLSAFQRAERIVLFRYLFRLFLASGGRGLSGYSRNDVRELLSDD
jgi:copper chaperone CopZ